MFFQEIFLQVASSFTSFSGSKFILRQFRVWKISRIFEWMKSSKTMKGKINLSVLCNGLIVLFFTISSPLLFGQAPTVQDCAGAIPVCQPVYTTMNSYTGHGNVYPEIHAGQACPYCMDGEKNDVFYVITVQTDGILRFSLTPNNPSNDYDWSMFNMTNSDCSQIYSNALQLQVSCNSYGVTGTNGPTGINSLLANNKDCNGPGTTAGPAWNRDLQVHAGQTYVLNISNWSTTQQSGYTLDFSGSTAVIYDNVAPVIDSIQQQVLCSGAAEILVRFSENVKCSDVYQHPEKFTLSGSQGGPYTITGVTNSDCALGGNQAISYLLSVSPPVFAGDYILNVVGDIHDLCGNIAVYQPYSFHVTEINAPTASAGNDTTIANGTSITLHGNASGGTGPYSFHWEPASLLVNPDVQNPQTVNMGATTQFHLTVTASDGCHGNDDVLVTIVGGPLGVAASADPGTICSGSSSALHALGTGGSGNYSYTWTSTPPGFNSGLQDPTVYPLQTTTYHVALYDGFNTVTGSTTVQVNPKPVASAGSPLTIPFGTNATLNGTAGGGSGSYTYYWTSLPPGYASNLPNPTFTNIQSTTVFRLVVTDLITDCESEASDVSVTVTGGPLSANPVAGLPVICQGITTQLHAMAGGGSGNYSYSWTSQPAGYTSFIADPFVNPLVPTIYYVTVSDGFNQTTGSVLVHVNPRPVVSLGPHDTTLCVYDMLLLDAGNPNSAYYWSNGATSQTIQVAASGMGFEVQEYQVRVTNSSGCSDSASIEITFSYAACTGVSDKTAQPKMLVWPNPGTGLFNVKMAEPKGPFTLTVSDMPGRILYSEDFNPGFMTFRTTIDLGSLSQGIYILRAKGLQEDRTQKIIIVK